MTVCIAAICDKGNGIAAVADNMMVANRLTAHLESKIIPITRPVCAMIAGNVPLQTEILRRIIDRFGIYEQLADPPYKWKVKTVADAFQQTYLDIRKERIETEILGFYLLDLKTWREKQHTLSDKIIRTIESEIQDFQMPNVATIIMGLDKTGDDPAVAHLYVIENDKVECRDLIGYACIGDGSSLAESEFIHYRYKTSTPIPIAMQVAFDAHVKAQAVSTVGSGMVYTCIVDEDSEYYKLGLLTDAGFKKLLADSAKQRNKYATQIDEVRFSQLQEYIQEKLKSVTGQENTENKVDQNESIRGTKSADEPKQLRSGSKKGKSKDN